ncbi:putative deacylase [Paraburkholderia sp. RAU2J]|uniref:succinylglutamate desuccinylase/aspartoacylase family protein n=1 Tax=Paraburkholderia sp. RAU2J TaxID=1938810 RepID=UPI000EAD0EFD|nr:succinylglutamate desuccinylase/aspartoacylase family protein [Paraburkholderia sp. RAU2J]RKT10364.1 putative deacylase [Paraburkholderia sp. RAU2J]
MKKHKFPLVSPAVGTQREVVASTFGKPAEKKVYLQSSLHADEIPAMLVSVMLQKRLQELESSGKIRGEITLVPVANPISLNQHLLGQFLGCFEMNTSRNFNRQFYPLRHLVPKIAPLLSNDKAENMNLIRSVLREGIDLEVPRTEFDSLQLTLLKLACDADIVLDLHCSLEADVHIYTNISGWSQIEPLARYLGSTTQLLGNEFEGGTFDETIGSFWCELRNQCGISKAVPDGAVAATVELRGERDVSYAYARKDADAIIDYLTYQGVIEGEVKPLPPLPHSATLWASREEYHAPHSGIVVYIAKVGILVDEGDPLFDIVDPLDERVTTVKSRTRGVFYMRHAIRFATAGAEIGRVTGRPAV